MILISHRGNITGKVKELENEPNYIDNAIVNGFDVEVDIWLQDGNLFLGHDRPEYQVDFDWIETRKSKLWIHCKNIDSLSYLKEIKCNLNYFWHQTDDVTLTSLGYLWTFPGKQLTKNSIAVLPELISSQDIEISQGICSDFIENFKKK